MTNDFRAPMAEPAPAPAEGEVGELVAVLRADAECAEAYQYHLCNMTADQMRRTAELLERQAAPVPVPVSERLPGDELCWWYQPDEDDGYGGTWTLLCIRGYMNYCYTHWLPAQALPLPPAEEVQP